MLEWIWPTKRLPSENYWDYEARRKGHKIAKFKSIGEWADLYGETLMSRSQFEREEEQEKDRRRQERDEQNYILTLTAAELDWLLFDLMDGVMVRYGDGTTYSEKVRAQRNIWWAQADTQGYEVF